MNLYKIDRPVGDDIRARLYNFSVFVLRPCGGWFKKKFYWEPIHYGDEIAELEKWLEKRKASEEKRKAEKLRLPLYGEF